MMVLLRDAPHFRLVSPRPLVLVLLGLWLHAASSQGTGSISGTVLDPSGALVPQATIVLHPKSGPDRTAQTGRDGRYVLSMEPGSQVTLTVQAQGFAPLTTGPLTFTGRPLHLDLKLKILAETEQVDVPASADTTDPNQNGDAIILKGDAIEQLPLDTAELQQQLAALAGSPAPDIYLNGFSNGTLPPRDTIREIRINQNPYSAQNDTNPTNGRVEIFTKPGTGRLHGSLYVRGNDSSFNSLNPFVTQEPAYHDIYYAATLNGPITPRTSFFLYGTQETEQSNAIIDAQTLDANLNQVAFSDAIPAPTTTYGFSARLDTSLGAKSTVIGRYTFDQTQQVNGGVGQFALASQGYTNDTTSQTLQLSNSQILSKNIVNDTRFEYIRSRVHQDPVSTAPSIDVEGAFTGGGNNGGAYHDNQDRFELQNYVSQAVGKHFLNYGGRLRSTRDANASSANYNGTYTFSSLASYQANQQGVAAGQTPAQIAAAGGGPSQFSYTTGNPNTVVSVVDAGLFFQDDWRLRLNLTLSGGLRFETQDAIHDHADWGPRLGAAWSVLPGKNKQPRYTLRAGAGVFYKRFASGYLLQAIRQNGLTQQEYVINSPYLAQQPASGSTVFQISPEYHAPYFVNTTLSLERRLGTYGSITASYNHNRGSHTQLTRNINAPLPGTYNLADPTSGVRPLGGTQSVYEYDSAGLYRDTRLNTNINLQFKQHIYVYGFYQYRLSNTDDNGGNFPSDSYNLLADYGPVPNSPRHQLNFSAGSDLPFGFSVYTFVRAASGLPFNITLDYDLNGDAQFNDRPTFATDLTRPSVAVTAYGAFDTHPLSGQQTVPYNFAQGPALFNMNLTVRRIFHFGTPRDPGPGTPATAPQEPKNRRYTLELSADANNVLNHVNLSTPVGTLGSPLFGHSTALANGFSNTANRIVVVQTYFRF